MSEVVIPSTIHFDPDFLGHVPAPTASIDLIADRIIANRAFFDVLRYDPADHPTLEMDDIGSSDERGQTRRYLGDLVNSDQPPPPFLRRFTRSDGSTFLGHAVTTRLRDEHHRVKSLVMSFHELPPRLADLHEASSETPDRSVDTFVASVGHELRSPLHSIIGLAELLAGAPNLTTADRDLAQAVLEQASGLGRLVDDLLDYSKVYGAAINLQVDEVSPHAVVRAVTKIHERKAAAKGLTFDVSIAEETPAHFVSDRLRVQQILTNLVGNAIRYSDAGAVHIGVDAPGSNQIRFIVEDNGPGISDEFIPTLFDPFTQDHKRLTGTGLGLAITKRLSAVLGGSVGVESTRGSGSIFTVLLPLTTSQPHQPRVTSVPRRTRSRSTSGHILVVEDEQVNQLLATNQLTKLGYLNTIVDNGRAAIAAIEHADPDSPFVAVLMDWHLPGIDGLETTRLIRAQEAASADEPYLPIIGVTANAMLGDRDRCLAAGMDEFLAKPVSLGQLGEVLETWICPIDLARGQELLQTDVLVALADELGDSFAAAGLMRTFLAELPARLDPMQRCLQHEPVEARDLHRAVHSLKSTCALIGAPIVASACSILEGLVRDVDDPMSLPGARNWFLSTLSLARRLADEVTDQLGTAAIR